ncbi:MAG: porin family protein [Alphaproteobacteria bacterium]|nr:porin family protein [Alphaproteobacteria bacterium]
MKKLILLGLVLGSIGVAQADTNPWAVIPINKSDYQGIEQVKEKVPANNFDVSVGVSSSETSKGDSGTGYKLGASYTTYQNEHVFLQPSVQYITSGNSYGDKYLLGNLDIGYKYDIQNSFVKSISPKIGVGVYKAIYDGGSNYGIAYNAGVEVGITERTSIDVSYNYLKGQNSGSHIDLTTVSLKYKF